jgi:tetratricopeptide (TPR) repeat protein
MEKQTLKQLKRVLLVFVILMIPLSYVLYVAIKTDEVYFLVQESQMLNAQEIDNEELLRKIDFIMKLNPWNNALYGMKVNILISQKQYQSALKCSKERDAYITTGLIYEYLNEGDSAKIYYKKEVNRILNKINQFNDNPSLKRNLERQLAMLYKFIGDNENSVKYMKEIPDDIDYQEKKNLEWQDFYIENYKGGGYKNFLEGEISIFGTDSIPTGIDIDSLITANRFYYNGKSEIGETITYEIRKIFEQKAIECGMNKIE